MRTCIYKEEAEQEDTREGRKRKEKKSGGKAYAASLTSSMVVHLLCDK